MRFVWFWDVWAHEKNSVYVSKPSISSFQLRCTIACPHNGVGGTEISDSEHTTPKNLKTTYTFPVSDRLPPNSGRSHDKSGPVLEMRAEPSREMQIKQ